LLLFISNRLTNSGSATYRRRFGIGMMDFRIMAMLSLEPGASGARIAEVIALDKAAVSRTLKSLERRGFVTAKPGLGRARVLTLTAEGRAVYKKMWTIAQERERRLLINLSPKEQEVLRDLLRRLLAAASFVGELAQE
jgi:DNA-binding MarR family transcriptional regulator